MPKKQSEQFEKRDERYHLSDAYAARAEKVENKKSKNSKKDEE